MARSLKIIFTSFKSIYGWLLSFSDWKRLTCCGCLIFHLLVISFKVYLATIKKKTKKKPGNIHSSTIKYVTSKQVLSGKDPNSCDANRWSTSTTI